MRGRSRKPRNRRWPRRGFPGVARSPWRAPRRWLQPAPRTAGPWPPTPCHTVGVQRPCPPKTGQSRRPPTADRRTRAHADRRRSSRPWRLPPSGRRRQSLQAPRAQATVGPIRPAGCPRPRRCPQLPHRLECRGQEAGWQLQAQAPGPGGSSTPLHLTVPQRRRPVLRQWHRCCRCHGTFP